MEFAKIHNKGQARLFQNQYLEYLTKTHPFVIWGIYVPIIVAMLYYSVSTAGFSIGKMLLVFLSGAFFWSLFEYLIHRFIFHYTADTPTGKKITYILHGNHHEFPRDKQRLFMPPVPSLILASVVFMAMFFIAKVCYVNLYVFSFFPGFMLGYLIYGTMHYAIHACNPPFKWMKPLWRNHHLHHYKQDHCGFGVSSTLWDQVFGTMFDLKIEKEDPAKVKELMFARSSSKQKAV